MVVVLAVLGATNRMDSVLDVIISNQLVKKLLQKKELFSTFSVGVLFRVSFDSDLHC